MCSCLALAAEVESAAAAVGWPPRASPVPTVLASQSPSILAAAEAAALSEPKLATSGISALSERSSFVPGRKRGPLLFTFLSLLLSGALSDPPRLSLTAL